MRIPYLESTGLNCPQHHVPISKNENTFKRSSEASSNWVAEFFYDSRNISKDINMLGRQTEKNENKAY
uniref:Uncharacterized protein n=1 Tax=Bracon brevicornis TaxID=1563983 RepID=A0A6V7JLU1_9HYME